MPNENHTDEVTSVTISINRRTNDCVINIESMCPLSDETLHYLRVATKLLRDDVFDALRDMAASDASPRASEPPLEPQPAPSSHPQLPDA